MSELVRAERKVGATPHYVEPETAQEIRALEQAMGGRRGLLGALLHAPANPSLDYVIGILSDPRNDQKDLALLCHVGKVQVPELIEAYKVGVMARAQVQAITSVARHLPSVVEDAMVRAAPHTLSCEACQGTGSITPEPTKDRPNPEPEPCKGCRGSGVIGVQPDLDRQKFATELAGMGKVAAPLVDLSDRRKVIMQDASPQGLASLIGAVDALLHRRSPAPTPEPPREGEVVESQP